MNSTLFGLVLLTSFTAGPGTPLILERGSVACRSKAALEAMREAGGFERLPEFLVGTACFRLSSPLDGRIKSLDESGAVEVATRKRRSITQPASLWVERSATPVG